jgi:NAD(P)-dependent dehydrogenase (short-subunit alcohol dehydrogenase family)
MISVEHGAGLSSAVLGDVMKAGKVAIVTGAARGIGRACAEQLAREGADVALFDVEDVLGEVTAKEIVAIQGAGKVAFYHCDVGYKDSVDGAVAAVLKDFGKIDILVNNAGIMRRADFVDLSEKDFDDVIRTNLKSVFLCGQAVARHMIERGEGGSIVNMSSTSVIMTMPTISPYAASKGGVSSLTRSMSLSLAPHGIRVNAVGPGTIVTELNRDALISDPATRDRILSRTPIGRFGTGEDVASVVSFLAGEGAAYVTGQTVYIDGGRAGLNYTMPVPQKSG